MIWAPTPSSRRPSTQQERVSGARTTAAVAASLGLLAVLVLTACDAGSDQGSTSPTSSATATSSADATARCALDHPPVSTVASPVWTDPPRAPGRVGVLLSGATASGRSAPVDARLLRQALRRSGVRAEVEVAPGDPDNLVADARGMVTGGVQVLILGTDDDAAAIRVDRIARRAGVPVIEYDHLGLQGTAPYYVSFDAEDVGRLQAHALLDCLAAQGVQDPKVMVLDGDTDADENAVLRSKGAHEVLDPALAAGTAQVVSEAAVTGSEADDAARVFRRSWQAAGGDVDGVVAGTADIARAVIGVLDQEGQTGVMVVGQGTGAIGARAVVSGHQSATVFQDSRQEAEGAARLAATLLAGKEPSAFGLSLVDLPVGASGEREIRALLLPGQVVTQADVGDLVHSGRLTLEQVCRHDLAACAAQGIS